ncbi:hypothetical protein T492DRAFT_1062545 [Pavlovales sp. CCMP2436]|nr:hypothetical protein T492DRAFT_1062545 [Pavlovales sp. CCMP2436]
MPVDSGADFEQLQRRFEAAEEANFELLSRAWEELDVTKELFIAELEQLEQAGAEEAMQQLPALRAELEGTRLRVRTLERTQSAIVQHGRHRAIEERSLLLACEKSHAHLGEDLQAEARESRRLREVLSSSERQRDAAEAQRDAAEADRDAQCRRVAELEVGAVKHLNATAELESRLRDAGKRARVHECTLLLTLAQLDTELGESRRIFLSAGLLRSILAELVALKGSVATLAESGRDFYATGDEGRFLACLASVQHRVELACAKANHLLRVSSAALALRAPAALRPAVTPSLVLCSPRHARQPLHVPTTKFRLGGQTPRAATEEAERRDLSRLERLPTAPEQPRPPNCGSYRDGGYAHSPPSNPSGCSSYGSSTPRRREECLSRP